MIGVFVNGKELENVLSVDAVPKENEYEVTLTCKDGAKTFMAENWYLDDNFKFWIKSDCFERD